MSCHKATKASINKTLSINQRGLTWGGYGDGEQQQDQDGLHPEGVHSQRQHHASKFALTNTNDYFHSKVNVPKPLESLTEKKILDVSAQIVTVTK